MLEFYHWSQTEMARNHFVKTENSETFVDENVTE